ncbi:hypothetical protein D3C76_1744310 [compost metagenome]
MKINSAVEELSGWVEGHGADDVADKVRATLAKLDENLVFITRGVTTLANDR